MEEIVNVEILLYHRESTNDNWIISVDRTEPCEFICTYDVWPLSFYVYSLSSSWQTKIMALVIHLNCY